MASFLSFLFVATLLQDLAPSKKPLCRSPRSCLKNPFFHKVPPLSLCFFLFFRFSSDLFHFLSSFLLPFFFFFLSSTSLSSLAVPFPRSCNTCLFIRFSWREGVLSSWPSVELGDPPADCALSKRIRARSGWLHVYPRCPSPLSFFPFFFHLLHSSLPCKITLQHPIKSKRNRVISS